MKSIALAFVAAMVLTGCDTIKGAFTWCLPKKQQPVNVIMPMPPPAKAFYPVEK